MFGLFKKKSEVDRLYDKYEKLMAESHRLSTSNRTASDAKVAEAEEVLRRIAELKSNA